MANNSTVAGYLTPQPSPAPLEGDALINFFQEWIVGITGMISSSIRPRWQAEPPNIPLDGVDWAAFGIVHRESQVYNAEIHFSVNNGYDELRNHEDLHLLISFYGANADANASLLRDGMGMAQNREILQQNNMGVVSWGNFTVAPDMIKEKWLYRVDFPFVIRRQIVRQYAVENLQSGHVTINNEHYVETINV